MPLPEGQGELVEGPPEPLQKEGAAFGIFAQQADTNLSVRESKDRDLVLDLVAGTRDEQLQHGRDTVLTDYIGDERLGAGLVRAADGDGPVALESGDESGELPQPRRRPGRHSLVAHDRWDVDHFRTLAHTERVTAGGAGKLGGGTDAWGP